MRGKRNFTRTAVHAAPRPFLFIALNVKDSQRLDIHLVSSRSHADVLMIDYWNQNDQFFISHDHQADDELPHLEEIYEQKLKSGDDASISSVVHTPPATTSRMESQAVLITSEV